MKPTCSAGGEWQLRSSIIQLMQAQRRGRARVRSALVPFFFGILFCISSAAFAASATAREQAAILNNIGVAFMNQQLEEKAIAKFNDATKADPTLAAAELNKGIAYLNLQKLTEAAAFLEQVGKSEPDNPRVWYNLGLVRRSEAKPAEAIQAFQRVAQIDPHDADTHYFLGSLYLQMQQFDQAKQEFETALKLNPVHASAEFGLARALQRQGNADAAREHLQRFQHLTQNKISSAITTTYGEQGPYSLVEQAKMPEPSIEPMIPIKLAPKEIGSAAAGGLLQKGELAGGACLIDLDGDGRMDLVTLGAGDHAIHAYRNMGDGNFTEMNESQTGLKVSGNGVSCAVGDFDSDELPDLAISTSDRVWLFRNQGGGKFIDVTEKAGIQQLNQPAGLTFVDFDHDGDLDLFITGSAKAAGSNVLWRNNGNGTFTEWTGPTALGGSGSTLTAVLSDINNDRAVDLVVTGSGGSADDLLQSARGSLQSGSAVHGHEPRAGNRRLRLRLQQRWMDGRCAHPCWRSRASHSGAMWMDSDLSAFRCR